VGPIQPPIVWVLWALSSGGKAAGREADHSLPSSAEVKNVWSYTPVPRYVFVAWCSVKNRHNVVVIIVVIDIIIVIMLT
jgi:hypothetical protein